MELYQLEEILPNVYHMRFEDRYQAAAHFLRVQEFYESPKFRGQIFTWIDYMEWYAEAQGEGSFTYPIDWSGFNVPSWVLASVYMSGAHIKDFNKYDRTMSQLTMKLHDKAAYGIQQTHPFYLIGTSGGDKYNKATLEHEMAHGLYFTDREYKAGMDELIAKVKPAEREAIHKILRDMGYADNVLDDELQAYYSTGLIEAMKKVSSYLTRRKFAKFFRKIRDDRKKRL